MTNAQKIFCNEYLKHLNATEAYKVAYPRCKKEESARKAGSRLLTNVDIQNYIDEQMKEREERTRVTQDMVINELKAIAFTNATEFAEIRGNFAKIKNTQELPEEVKKAIVGIEEGKEGVKVKVANKLQALELLGRHLGMFKDKLEISKPTGEITAEIDKYIQEKLMSHDE